MLRCLKLFGVFYPALVVLFIILVFSLLWTVDHDRAVIFLISFGCWCIPSLIIVYYAERLSCGARAASQRSVPHERIVSGDIVQCVA